MDKKEFKIEDSLNGRVGTHIKDGIYKVKNPYRVNIDDWGHDKVNHNCTIIGANYSDDYTECDVHYFTKDINSPVSDFVNELNKGKSKEYGFTPCMYMDMIPRIGGGFIVGI